MRIHVVLAVTLFHIVAGVNAFHLPAAHNLQRQHQRRPRQRQRVTNPGPANRVAFPWKDGERKASGVGPLASVEEHATTELKTGTAGWAQKTLTIKVPRWGCHLITSEITHCLPEIRLFKIGMANIFLKHTSASLTINENYTTSLTERSSSCPEQADPDVRTDMESALNEIVPVRWHVDLFRHTIEGPDDMTGHVKCSIMGTSLNIPITNGCLGLGVWQGIYLCEHRDFRGGFERDITITVQGITAD